MLRKIRAVTVWTALLVVLLAGAARPTPAEPLKCNRVTFQKPPLWISGAAGTDDGSGLLVVDPFRNQLVSYDSQGGSQTVSAPHLKSAKDFLPARIAKTAGGFLLETADGSLVGLDKQLRVTRESTLTQKSLTEEHVGSLYQWTLAGDKLVGFGTLTKTGQSYELGFLRAPLQPSGQVEMLKPFANGDFYLLGYSYLATLGDDVYFVLMDKHPAIYRVSPGSAKVEKLKSFPAEYQILPDFQTPPPKGPKSAPARYAELETFTMPAGLYAQDGILYLLTRKPDGPAATAWWVYKIDPRKDVILGRMKLPTSANHLLIVPTAENWFAIERGRVEEKQRQQIQSMVVLPSAAISSLSVPATCSSLKK
ncbi:MAG: hypothetical protein WAM82_00240 [Thermoanaerobaculia bacterium]